MAVNESRNLNAELKEGLTDGAVKKQHPDRGGAYEPDNHTHWTLQQQYNMGWSMPVEDAIADRLWDGGIRKRGVPHSGWSPVQPY